MTTQRNDLEDFSPTQQAAINSLNRALSKAKSAGLALCGMDNSLLAYDGQDLDDAYDQTGDLYAAQLACGQGMPLSAGGVYRDSGGW